MTHFMNKIDAFKTTNSLANAKKLAAHIRKHPMVECMLTETDAHIVREALRLVEKEG